jgi:hypothetical protein
MLHSIWRALSRGVYFIVWLAVAVLAVYPVLLWAQPEPPFRDFKARAVIEYNGVSVTIEGSLRCTRSLTWVPFGDLSIPPHGGNSYSWSDVGIGQRLADGSAVIVALHPPCHSPTHIEPFSYPDGTYPVVYWLDKADRPDRVEAYFDRSGYESPHAKLKLKHMEMTYTGRSVLPRFRATEAVRAVPWASQELDVRRDRAKFVAYLAITEPELDWSKRPRTVEILSKQASWRRFSKGNDRTAYEAVRRSPVSEFYLTCREFAENLRQKWCDAIRKALTVEVRGGRFILPKGRSTTGMAVFARDRRAAGQPVPFDLFGRQENINDLNNSIAPELFFEPDQRLLVGLKRYLLIW